MGMSREYYIAELKARYDVNDIRDIVEEHIVNIFLDGGFDDKGGLSKENIWDYAKDVSRHMQDDEIMSYILDEDLLEVVDGALN
jgi:hypothetical protein